MKKPINVLPDCKTFQVEHGGVFEVNMNTDTGAGANQRERYCLVRCQHRRGDSAAEVTMEAPLHLA